MTIQVVVYIPYLPLKMFVVKLVLLLDGIEHQGGVDAALLKAVWF